jgi:hypothetical protein
VRCFGPFGDERAFIAFTDLDSASKTSILAKPGGAGSGHLVVSAGAQVDASPATLVSPLLTSLGRGCHVAKVHLSFAARIAS